MEHLSHFSTFTAHYVMKTLHQLHGKCYFNVILKYRIFYSTVFAAPIIIASSGTSNNKIKSTLKILIPLFLIF